MIYHAVLSILSLALISVASPSASLAGPTTFDYVIAGGGATGLSLAVRLSEDSSKTVLVLEAGERYESISISFPFFVINSNQWFREVCTRPNTFHGAVVYYLISLVQISPTCVSIAEISALPTIGSLSLSHKLMLAIVFKTKSKAESWGEPQVLPFSLDSFDILHSVADLRSTPECTFGGCYR